MHRFHYFFRFFFWLLISLSIINCSDSSGLDNKNTKRQVPDPFEQNLLLQKTINLGNALEAPNEGDWGITLQESYFEIIADAGFTAVRVPIRWSAHSSNNAPYTIDPLFVARIIWVLDQAEKNNLAVVINIHHFDEIFSDPEQNKAKFLALWQQLSEWFADRSLSVFYEVLNEPHDNLTGGLRIRSP